MNLVLIAKNESGLLSVKQELHKQYPTIQIRTYCSDFSDANSSKIQKILNELSDLDISTLIINAGYGFFEV